MLVVTYSNKEVIQVGDNILIRAWVDDVGHLKVGIEAPKDVRIIRVPRKQLSQAEKAA